MLECNEKSILVLSITAMLVVGGDSNMMGGMGGMRGWGGRGGGRGGGIGMHKMGLPPGMTMIDGEMVDMANKVVQRVGGGAGGKGTMYYSWANQKGPPLFNRREADTGRKFVVFPDRSYPPGDGHYIVLRRMKRNAMKRGPVIYEAFYLDLGDSIKAMVTQFNSRAFGDGGGGGGGAIGGVMRRGRRRKRNTVLRVSKEHEDSYEKNRRRHRKSKRKGKLSINEETPQRKESENLSREKNENTVQM